MSKDFNNHKGWWKELKEKNPKRYKWICAKMSKSKQGSSHSLAVRKKMSERMKGNKRGFKKGMVPWNKGKSHEAVKGEKNPNWAGGTTFDIYHRVRTKEWKQLVKLILKRDNYICQNCGTNENLHVHHIIPYRLIHDDNPKNLLALCRRCHALFDNKLRREEIGRFC